MKIRFIAALAAAIFSLPASANAKVFTIDFSPNTGSMTQYGSWLSKNVEFYVWDGSHNQIKTSIINGSIFVPANGSLLASTPCCTSNDGYPTTGLFRFDVSTSAAFKASDLYDEIGRTYYPDTRPGFETVTLWRPLEVSNYNAPVLTAGNSDTFFDNFSFASSVPEPASWGMMIVGSAMVGGAVRRRRKTVTAFA